VHTGIHYNENDRGDVEPDAAGGSLTLLVRLPNQDENFDAVGAGVACLRAAALCALATLELTKVPSGIVVYTTKQMGA
tara:strand:+ start:372 stop:605 length:234 start_codon:yes stop_codon:yes gene_type:complete